MAKIILNGHTIEANTGDLLSDIISKNINFDMPCAGHGRCGKCKVYTTGNLSPICEKEKEFLTKEEQINGIRLACYARVTNDCTITTIKSTKSHILTEKKTYNNKKAIFSNYAVALDIGTTTLAACLYSNDGKILASYGTMNPQKKWGADVISRIDSALHGNKEDIANSIQNSINKMLIMLCKQANININSIDAMVITGNTAMLYLLTKTDTFCLSRAPFETERIFGEFIKGNELNLINKNCNIYLPRCISAFVGADTTTAILSSNITSDNNKVKMLVDIGTNGEIALFNKGSLTCCSTAAGPAFEGAGISMGMNGNDGAIDHINLIDNKPYIHVLGDIEPIGICGSGIIDALSYFLKTKQIDETGLLENDPTTILNNVVITQKDIRSIQLAKSAISSGIYTLPTISGLSLDDIDTLFIAGGFGSYLNVKSACDIGLIPKEFINKVEVIGNSALNGASMILFDENMISISEQIAKSAKTIDLSTNTVFINAYTDNMLF